ncbi:MAG: toprim domain-containing protein [Candidatus Dormibacteria bacterium]
MSAGIGLDSLVLRWRGDQRGTGECPLGCGSSPTAFGVRMDDDQKGGTWNCLHCHQAGWIADRVLYLKGEKPERRAEGSRLYRPVARPLRRVERWDPPPAQAAEVLRQAHDAYRRMYQGSPAREYLVSRGLADERDGAAPLDAGYAPGGFVLRDAGIDLELAWNLGLIRKDGRDWFFNRVVVPYTWKGRTTCLHGRDIGPESLPLRSEARFEVAGRTGDVPDRAVAYDQDPIVYVRLHGAWRLVDRDPSRGAEKVRDEFVVRDGDRLVSRLRAEVRAGDQVLVWSPGVIRQLRHLYTPCSGRPASDLTDRRYAISERDLDEYPWLRTSGRLRDWDWARGVYGEASLAAPRFMVVEAALDALAARAVGQSQVVATGGTGLDALLSRIGPEQRVMVCMDHDRSGDQAWARISGAIQGRAVRVRIPASKKDWAEFTEYRRQLRRRTEVKARSRRNQVADSSVSSAACPPSDHML